ncbi:hypothetical protein [Streptomyces tateyamensis]|uniref:hypothetical protein n=1 Tax=Streptomyces tateyamensis TaxID=565073 RepID=UPI0011B672C5|nr:hypothetical protein [Streptomyces tateyamensis]
MTPAPSPITTFLQTARGTSLCVQRSAGCYGPAKPKLTDYLILSNPLTQTTPYCASNTSWVERACSGVSGYVTAAGTIDSGLTAARWAVLSRQGKAPRWAPPLVKAKIANNIRTLNTITTIADSPWVRWTGKALIPLGLTASAVSGFESAREDGEGFWGELGVAAADTAGDFAIGGASSVAGGAAGALAGSWFPGPGDIIGGVAGAISGSFAAVPLENKFHDSVLGFFRTL